MENIMTHKNQIEEAQVSWKVDNIDMNATLTQPAGSGPFPAVVMVAGSGPTDRNWNSPFIPGTNGSAALFARVLSAANFVTLRYDKRASGPSAQENVKLLMGKISMQAHLDELAGGVRLLASRQDVDPHHLFVLANSEGCIHALNYQAQATDLPFAGLILTGAPARPVGVVGRSQIASQLTGVPGGEKMLAAYDAAIDLFVAGQPVNVDENLPEGMRNLIMALTSPINQPFSRELWMLDPLAVLAKITAPILIVIGKKDLQIDWQADGKPFEEIAAKRNNITLALPENANHVLKYEPRPRSDLSPIEVGNRYNADDEDLDPETIELITSWMRAQL
jgi:pimeloyl-ACP methyl ester carboxylesterase